MAKVEEAVPVGLGFGNIEVGSNQGDEDGIKDVENELVEDLGALLEIGQRDFLPFIG